jgi:hypothetical protein
MPSVSVSVHPRVSCTGCFIVSDLMLHTTGIRGIWPPWETIPAFYMSSPWIFVSFCLNLFTLGGNLQLLYEQWKAISNNLTHNEVLAGLKYSYFRNRQGELENPFARGLINNLVEFFFHTVDYTKLYHLAQLDSRNSINNNNNMSRGALKNV